MPTNDERREVARRLRHEARTCIHSVLLSPDDALRLADLVGPSCDRDALLALADEFESGARDARAHKWNEPANATMAIALADEYEANARRIREACGEADG